MRPAPSVVVTTLLLFCLPVALGGAVKVEMKKLPKGTFTMGNDDELSAPIATNQPAHKVTVSKFTMSKYEITNEQYVEFLNDAETAGQIEVSTRLPGGGEFVIGAAGHPSEGLKLYELSGTNGEGESVLNIPWIDYDGSAPLGKRFTLLDSQDVFGNDDALDTADWPAAFVKWDGAMAFAFHNGYTLPTEAQWEYATQGGQGLMYGTNDGTLTLENANWSGQEGPGEIHEDAVGHATAVGTYPANPFGLYDLAGNVWEWTLDLYDGDFYTDSTGAKDPVNMVGIDGTSDNPSEADGCKGGPSTVYTCNTRLKRGGSWNFHQTTIRSEARNTDYNFRGNDHFGFRIAGSSKKPKKPGKMTADVGSQGTVTLSWVDKANNEARFDLECKAGNGAWMPITSTYPNVEETTVTLDAGTSYQCRLTAGNAKGTSGARKVKFNT